MKIKKYLIAISICVISFFLVSALAPAVTAGSAPDSESMVIGGSVDNVIEDPGDGGDDGNGQSGLDAWLHPGDLAFMDVDLQKAVEETHLSLDEWENWLAIFRALKYKKKDSSDEHAAIYIGGNAFVEACGEIKKTMYEDFDWAKNIVFYYVNANPKIKEKAANWALGRLNDNEGYQTGMEGQFWKKWWDTSQESNIIDIEFGDNYAINTDTSTKFYCSEIAWAAYKNVEGDKDLDLDSDTHRTFMPPSSNSGYYDWVLPADIMDSEHTSRYGDLAVDLYLDLEVDVDETNFNVVCSAPIYEYNLGGDPIKYKIDFKCDGESFTGDPEVLSGKLQKKTLTVEEKGRYQISVEVENIATGETATASEYIDVSLGSVETGSCFLADTKIAMADGNIKNIQDIHIGDLVESFDEQTMQCKPGYVSSVFHHSPEEMTDYYLILNDDLKVTPNHPVYVKDKWITADELQIGDYFGVEITSIQRVYQRVPTYNFEVETYHTYNVIWGSSTSIVHNMGAETGESVIKKIGGNGGGGNIDGMEGEKFDIGFISTSGDKTPQAAATQPAIQQVQLCLDIDEFANINKNISPGLFFPILTTITPTSSSTQSTKTGTLTSNAKPSTNSEPTTSDATSLTLPNLNIYIIVEEVIKKLISDSKEKLVNDVTEETKDAKSSTSNSDSKEDIKIEPVPEVTTSDEKENIQQTKNQDVKTQETTTQNTNTVEDNTATVETKTTEEDISTQETTTINTVEDNTPALAEVNSQQTNIEIKTSCSAEDTKDSSPSSIDDSSAITKTIKDVSNSINLLLPGLL